MRREAGRLVHLVDETRIVAGVGDELRLPPDAHASHDPRSPGKLHSLDPLAHRSAGDLADQGVAVAEPDRAGLGVEGLDDAVEDAGKEVVEVEGRVELESRLVKEPQVLRAQAHRRGARVRAAPLSICLSEPG